MQTRGSLIAATLLCAVLVTVFWGFLQLDLPLAHYVRSLHVPWLERAGDLGYRLGSGAVLAGISGIMLIVGSVLKHPTVRKAGFESLLAHAVAGLAAQTLKHAIGRPRPRLMHGDSPFLLGLSFEPGLDSFPSGHASASFAVAAVLTRYFPKTGWTLYSLAALVALSRIVRGSHFPTDVMAGVCLGLLVGYVVAHPLRAWRCSLLEALTVVTPFLVATFGLVWIAVYPSFDQPANLIMASSGMMAVAVDMSVRLYRKLINSGTREKRFPGFPEANALITIGLALTSASILLAVLAISLSLAYWIMQHSTETQSELQPVKRGELYQPASLQFKIALTEAPLALLLVFSVLSIQHVKGLLLLFS